jgi:hypothetical protein
VSENDSVTPPAAGARVVLTLEIYETVFRKFVKDRSRVSRKELEWVRIKLRRYASEDTGHVGPFPHRLPPDGGQTKEGGRNA